MDTYARDAMERAARLSELELAAKMLPEPAAPRWDVRALLAAALALLITLYPGMSAAAGALTRL